MESIRAIARELRHALTTVAEEAARSSGCVQRVRQFTGGTLVQTLVFGWLANPVATLAELTRMAATRGVAVSPQALDQRFTPALASCLQRVLEHVLRVVITSDTLVLPLVARFNGVYVLDSTTVSLPDALAATWPGCGGNAGQGQAALKLVVRLDLCQGHLAGPDLVAGRASDRSSALQMAPLPPGSLRIADLGFFKVGVLRQISQAGAFFLTRWQANTALLDPTGRRWEDVGTEVTHAATAGAGGVAQVDVPVLVGATERLPARLVAVRVRQEVADQRRAQLKRRAQRAGYTARQASLALADWTILLTNVPVERLRVEEALVLVRARWQIELLFKRWKGLGRLDEWRSAQSWRIVGEVYAKLIGLVLQQWLVVVGCWADPEHSLYQASRVVSQHALGIAQTFDHLAACVAALTRLTHAMGVGCQLTRRKRRPSTAQLLRDPSLATLT